MFPFGCSALCLDYCHDYALLKSGTVYFYLLAQYKVKYLYICSNSMQDLWLHICEIEQVCRWTTEHRGTLLFIMFFFCSIMVSAVQNLFWLSMYWNLTGSPSAFEVPNSEHSSVWHSSCGSFPESKTCSFVLLIHNFHISEAGRHTEQHRYDL